MDANSREVDHPDHERTKCCFAWLGPGDFEARLLGPRPRHRLRDVLRTHFDAHPEQMAAVFAERPDGPLAVSHRTRSGSAVRYDHVLASYPDFEVRNVEYLFDGALKHGSDHALVVVDLRVQVAWGERSEVDTLLPTPLLPGEPSIDRKSRISAA